MKATESNIEVVSTLEGEDVDMQLDKTAMAHFMKMFTDLYSRPKFAVLREYSTNARDSHIEAGIDKPISVQLPTTLRASLIIQDWGIGMNKEDIKKTYSLYGASTKRDSDDFSGFLGIGGKSALTYCNQFTVKGIKDGIATVISVTRKQDGTGTMKILSETETEEENGVTITIPTYTGDTFKQEAIELFRWWPKGSVLVDGEPIAPAGYRSKVGDNIRVLHSGEDNYIIQGGVPYPWKETGLPVPVAVEVPIGSVNFVPSREELADDSHTRKTLEKIRKDYENSYREYCEKKMAEAKNAGDALRIYYELNFMGAFDPEYKGMKIPKEFKDLNGREMFYIGSEKYRPWSYYRRRRKTEYCTTGSVTPEDISHEGSFWFFNFNNETFTKQMREKMDAFVQHHFDNPGIDCNRSVLVRGDGNISNVEWIDPDRVFDWAEVKKFKLDGAQKTDSETYYPGYMDGKYNSEIPASDINKKKKILYIVGSPKSNTYSYDHNMLVNTAGVKDPQLFIIQSNRLKKFKRLFPNAQHLQDFYDKRGEKWWKNVSNYEKGILKWNLDYTDDRLVRFITTNKVNVKDKDIKKAIKKKKKQKELIDKYSGDYKKFFGKSLAVGGNEEPAKLSERYPLMKKVVQSYYSDDQELGKHVELYMNTVYEKEIA